VGDGICEENGIGLGSLSAMRNVYTSAHAASRFVAFGFGSNMPWRRHGVGLRPLRKKES